MGTPGHELARILEVLLMQEDFARALRRFLTVYAPFRLRLRRVVAERLFRQ
jgi:hypothetical protein